MTAIFWVSLTVVLVFGFDRGYGASAGGDVFF